VAEVSLARCRWPPLAAPYDEALRQAVAFVLAEFQPVGIVAAGSILRGEGDARSDIDLFVIHSAPFKQRLQRRFAGVPVEIFVNLPQSVREYFASPNERARPSTAHMIATGFVVLEDPVVDVLRAEAAGWLSKRSFPAADEAIGSRYRVATLLEDAEDVRERDPTMTSQLLCESVSEALRYWLHARNGVFPRTKAFLAQVRSDDPALGEACDRFFSSSDLSERVTLARQIVRTCVGAVEFFEWDSPRIASW
jgi:predicted nucleotidyltransferase